jgi:predicted transcriptional regulator
MNQDTKISQSSEPANPPLKTLAAEKTSALDAGDTVQAAGDRLREKQTAQWPVAEGRKLVGAVQQENPDWKLGGRGHDPKSWKVAHIMNREVAFCYEDQDCETALRTMDDRGLRFLPVVDREMRIVGIFSREEIEQNARKSAVSDGKDAS